jgi:hypothetical protein
VFYGAILPKIFESRRHFLKRMSESPTPSKVGLYEKFRSFTAKHLAPINTLLLLGATFGGGQLLDRMGFWPVHTPVEQQRPVAKPDELVSKPGAVADTASLPPSPSLTPMPVVTDSRLPAPVRQQKPTAAAQTDNDTLQTLSKQLDDERLKHANAILDATLK